MPGKPRSLPLAISGLLLSCASVVGHTANATWSCRPNPDASGWECTSPGSAASAPEEEPAPETTATEDRFPYTAPSPAEAAPAQEATEPKLEAKSREEATPDQGRPQPPPATLAPEEKSPAKRTRAEKPDLAQPVAPEERSAAEARIDQPASPELVPDTPAAPSGDATEALSAPGEAEESAKAQPPLADAPRQPTRSPAQPAASRIDEGLNWEICRAAPETGVQREAAETSPEDLVMHVSADGVEFWEAENLAIFSGDVELTRGEGRVEADWVRYDRNQELLDAEGDIFFSQPGLRVTGSQAHFDLSASRGSVKEVEYRLTDSQARGKAAVALVEGKEVSHYEGITYTTCRPGNDDWRLEAKKLTVDRGTGVGTVRHGTLRFGNLPVAYLPSGSFPIDGRRKTGFLVPSLGTSDRTGVEVATPYYFNLAPNYDATLTPRLLSKRGLMLGSQFRYLNEKHRGELLAEILPDDRDAAASDPDTRGAASWQHQGSLTPRLNTDINLNYVSDDNYLEDFGNNLDIASTRQLERRGDLRYWGEDWNLLGRLQYYQTVDKNIPNEDRPYSRLPQLLYILDKPDQHYGLTYHLDSEYDYFDHSDSNRVVGHRYALQPAVSLPLRRSYGHLTPKLSVHYRYYDLSNTEADQGNNPSLTMPTFNLDSGLVFERQADWFGNASTQTLEPRLFYLLTPYKNQDDLPVFDSSLVGFNFNSLFRENRFTGRDRIGDANQLTLALTSRTLSERAGTELLRASIGQIYYFRDRDVQLPDEPTATDNSSILAAETAARLSADWSTRANLFWNPHEGGQMENASVELHYQDPKKRIVNLGYRYNRGDETTDAITRISDTDVSVRWPLGESLHFIGRWKYSLFYERTMDSFAGFEYDRCCWILRALARHYIEDNVDDSNTTFMVQLELKGLGGIGSRVDSFLERGIFGYQAE